MNSSFLPEGEQELAVSRVGDGDERAKEEDTNTVFTELGDIETK